MICRLRFTPTLRSSVLVLSALCAGGVAADSITMKDGRVVSGTIRSQNREMIVIQTGGGTVALDRRTILRVTFGPRANESTASRSFHRGEKKPAIKNRNGPAPIPEPGNSILASPAPSYSDFLAAARLSEHSPPTVPPVPEPLPSELPPVPGPQTPPRAGQEEPRIPVPGVEYNALWRSAIFPGWGQWHQDRPGAGAAWAGLFTLSVFATADAYARYRGAFAAYQKTFNPFRGDPAGIAMAASGTFDVTRLDLPGYFAYQRTFRSRRAGVSRRHATFMVASAGTALVYCTNLMDASFEAKSAPYAHSEAVGGLYVYADTEGTFGAAFSLAW